MCCGDACQIQVHWPFSFVQKIVFRSSVRGGATVCHHPIIYGRSFSSWQLFWTNILRSAIHRYQWHPSLKVVILAQACRVGSIASIEHIFWPLKRKTAKRLPAWKNHSRVVILKSLEIARRPTMPRVFWWIALIRWLQHWTWCCCFSIVDAEVNLCSRRRQETLKKTQILNNLRRRTI